MDKKWWKESVVYQIYPRSFCDSNGDGIGDLNGITSKMDYLQELGIDVIWLSPVYQSPNADNGYDISDYQAIMEELGTMEDYDRMLKSAHDHGIKIVMDLVVNHTSDEHEWFIESRKSKDNPKRDYYIWREAKDGHEPNNWGSCFSGSAWKYDETTDMYYLHMFAEKQPDLNWENPVVRDEVFRMMTWWCDKGIDGFRMDVISMISKAEGLPDGKKGEGELYGDYVPYVCNGPHVHEYLQEMNQKVLSRYDLLTVGECAGVTLEEAKKYANSQGTELNMVFQFEHMDLDSDENCKWTDKKVPLPALKEIMNKWQTGLEGCAWNSLYWCNHDQPRMLSRMGNDSDEYRELSAKMLATTLHMMQGTPYVYQGEELGMTNVPFRNMDDIRDIESINAFKELTEAGIFDEETMFRYICYKGRDNSRTPVQWDDSENAGFTIGTPWIMVNPNYTKINAKEQVSRPDSVFNYYKKLIALRHTEDVIVYGAFELLMPDDEKVFAYTRTLDGTRLFVACNYSQDTVSVEVPADFAGRKAELLISNYGEQGETPAAVLRPYEAVVWKISK
ncbi:MAG: alpha-glucosidase [Lachnospiraceae bacterium]